MKKFINWHKTLIGKMQNKLRIDSYQTLWLSFVKGILIGYVICALSSCMGAYYLSDAEYIDAREENASITYYDNQIYWGWSNGYYYYYGKPHYYPWTYYYNTCPPSHYTHTTHIVITRPVNRPHTIIHKPTHRPNRPTIKTNTNRTNIKVKTNRTNIKVKTNNRSNVKTNSTNKKVTNRRRPK